MKLNMNETMNSTLKNVKNMSAKFSEATGLYIEDAFINFSVLAPLEKVKLALEKGEDAKKEIEYLKEKSGLFFDVNTKTVLLYLNEKDEDFINKAKLSAMLSLLELQPEIFPEVTYSDFLNKETTYKALEIEIEGVNKHFFVFRSHKNKDVYKGGIKKNNGSPKLINLFWNTKDEVIMDLLKRI